MVYSLTASTASWGEGDRDRVALGVFCWEKMTLYFTISAATDLEFWSNNTSKKET